MKSQESPVGESNKIAAVWCRCETGDCLHKSDCAVHNEPAEESDSCDCMTPAEKRALPGSHYSDGRRFSHISNAWIFAENWDDREEVARLQSQLAQLQAQNTALLAREKLLEGALKKFAEFPLKDFGGRNNPNHPIYGFNEWVLRVRHIDAARALLRPSGGEGDKKWVTVENSFYPRTKPCTDCAAGEGEK